ncbi:hypothetical protein [Agrobacterium sp. LAD9]|uniref:hypothetical protein n=1 Tax=Agrobacterium sp. LAD9 TaxID=2055153 RepID=UPI0012900E5A|nr:hypothetical protein [Agrobacterium sp. LAD9]
MKCLPLSVVCELRRNVGTAERQTVLAAGIHIYSCISNDLSGGRLASAARTRRLTQHRSRHGCHDEATSLAIGSKFTSIARASLLRCSGQIRIFDASPDDNGLIAIVELQIDRWIASSSLARMSVAACNAIRGSVSMGTLVVVGVALVRKGKWI